MDGKDSGKDFAAEKGSFSQAYFVYVKKKITNFRRKRLPEARWHICAVLP